MPYEALKKAKTIEPEPGLVEQAIAFLVGGLGLSGVPVPTATGPARAMGDTRASRLGEAIAMLAGLPVAGTVKKGIRMFHGSPHDFDKFSLSKIGTGEGAQAYGHGLYFAENEGTAKAYRDALPIPYKSFAESHARDALLRHNNDPVKAIESLRTTWAPSGSHEVGVIPDAIALIESGYRPPTGRMYEVNIHADPETLLDWDAPLSEQSQSVKDAFTKAYGKSPDQLLPMRGAQAYEMVGHGSKEQATEAFRRQGVPGLKYLDQGSRAAGEGTRNYVIFDDSLVEIMRKYGLLPPAAAGLMGEHDR